MAAKEGEPSSKNLDVHERALTSERWDEAKQHLKLKERKFLEKACEGFDQPLPSALQSSISTQQRHCDDKHWLSYTNENGETVYLRSVLEEIAGYIEKFKQFGDQIVQFAPNYAAIPWAAIRLVLQITVNDVQIFTEMAEGVRKVARVVDFYGECKAKYLHGSSNFKEMLSDSIVKLYVSVLKYLIAAQKYYSQQSFRRFLENIYLRSETVKYLLRDIEDDAREAKDRVQRVASEDTDKKINEGFKSMHQHLEPSLNDRRKSLLERIAGTFTDNELDIAREIRHRNTCNWMLQRPSFQAWKSCTADHVYLLWIHGGPGFGKTSTVSFLVGDTKADNDPAVIVCSWVAQMIRINDDAVELADEHLPLTLEPSTGTIWRIFEDMGKAIDKAAYVVDGFDERSPVNNIAKHDTTDRRLSFLDTLVNRIAKTKAHVLVVSRDIAVIRSCLGKGRLWPHDVVAYEYSISKNDTKRDIQTCCSTEFQTINCRERRVLKRETSKKCDGMFLIWHYLREELQHAHSNRARKNVLLATSQYIEDLYARELRRILGPDAKPSDRNQAVSILRLVFISLRPLEVAEMTKILTLLLDDSHEHFTYDKTCLPDGWKDNFSDYVNDQIRRPCGPLIELRKPSGRQNGIGKHTVHFYHCTVKEYFLQTNFHMPQTDDLNMEDAKVHHNWLAKICLQYLCYDIFNVNFPDDGPSEMASGNEPKAPPEANDYPFFRYACRFWHEHAIQEGVTSFEVNELALRLFDPSKTNWKTWATIFERNLCTEKFGIAHQNLEPRGINPSPLYYAAAPVSPYPGISLNDEGGVLGTPLQAAAGINHIEVVKYILKHGGDVNQIAGYFRCALTAAAANASPEVVQLLLDAGAAKQFLVEYPKLKFSPQVVASKNERLENLKLLAANGFSLSLPDGYFQPLGAAVAAGHTEVVRWLLENGANPNRRGMKRRHPILNAATHGHSEALWPSMSGGGSFEEGTQSALKSSISGAEEDYDAADVVSALCGKWRGSSTSLRTHRNVGAVGTLEMTLDRSCFETQGITVTFKATGTDDIGVFKIFGKAIGLSSLWWFKLYERRRCLYEATLNGPDGKMTGTWGANSTDTSGTFELTKVEL
ncbi:uncharacterized protein K452DRAFT_333149 [Aplosporella prunicola CBS 121167]|uniref:Uncharacterized protein n=1 Tax=Aplosporella prunicola CBS 121167 TaxID=1176127 RepID=A0A6A6ATL5_9PEZI|nr:uncharacterized protein K452DRAFT_333149 [Aplosporella prunicola CBS 121167]KAF2135352.1 hypothetical protein K452DRAFT_333149 [Aplosporella prunicola CBS 121167]